MALGHDDLADRDTLARKEVEALAVLDKPPRADELTIDQDTGTLFSRQTTFVSH